MKKIIVTFLCCLNIALVNAQIKSKMKADAFFLVALNNPKITILELVNEDISDTIDFDSDIIVEAGSNGLLKATSNGVEGFVISAKGMVTYNLGVFDNSMKDLTGLPNSKINISAITEGFHYADKIWYPTSSENAIIICLKDKIWGYNVKFENDVVKQRQSITTSNNLTAGVSVYKKSSFKDEIPLPSKLDSVSYSLGVMIGENNKKQINNTPRTDQLNKNILIEAFKRAFIGDSVLINTETANTLVRTFFTEVPKINAEEKPKLDNESVEQDLVIKEDGSVQTQKFIIPEKLWKTECIGTASNVMVDRLPNDKGSLDVDLYRSSQIDTSKVSILTGSLCDMVKGHNNSTFRIFGGKYLIKPCSGSDEKAVEILSQGLLFIYHSGIGLEYKSGSGTITMFDKYYKLPIK